MERRGGRSKAPKPVIPSAMQHVSAASQTRDPRARGRNASGHDERHAASLKCSPPPSAQYASMPTKERSI